LIKSDGTKVRTLLENKLPGYDEYHVSFPEFGVLKTSDNETELTYYLTKPHDFDETKKVCYQLEAHSLPSTPSLFMDIVGQLTKWQQTTG
jgi:hypothetical protein